MKRKYYEQKRREQLNRDMSTLDAHGSVPLPDPSVKATMQAAAQAELARSANPRFAGGGFNITTKS